MKSRYIFLLVVLLGLNVGCERGIHLTSSVSHASESKKTKYHCPMHPQITSDKPGQSCSICGMDLVPIEDEGNFTNSEIGEDSPQGRQPVKLSEYRKQLIGIRTEKVQSRDLEEVISAPGRMAFDPEMFTAQSEYVEALKQLGRVKDSPLEEVKRSTREMVQSAKTRLKVLGLSDSEINKLNRSRSASTGLILGGDRQRLVYAEVFESELSKIKKGQKAIVRGNFGKKSQLSGQVIAVDQLIDPKTRTAKVRVSIVDENIELPPQAFVSVDISVPLGNHLSVSQSAVLNNGKETFVFKKVNEGEYHPVKVTTSVQTKDYAILYSGVEEGDQVVSKANFLLDSESRLKSVIEKHKSSNSEDHSGHGH